MKTKAILIAALFAATGTSWASGLSIDSVDVSNIEPTNVEITEIKAQGPTDAFNVKVDNAEKVNTAKLKQSYGSNEDVSYDSLEDVL